MNKAMVLFQLDDLKFNLLRMDANYRTKRNKATTPSEIADMLKAIRQLKLSIEVGGFDEYFDSAETGGDIPDREFDSGIAMGRL